MPPTPRRNLTPNQFGDPSLSTDEAYAACGPAAAVAFALATGRNPTLREAQDLAKEVGWTADGGMNGVANQVRLLEKMGVDARLGNADASSIRQSVVSGQPVIVSTPKHYFVLDDYDPQSGQFYVGASGTALKAGREWLTLEEIAQLGSGINGALYVANPAAGGLSTQGPDVPSGEQTATTGGDGAVASTGLDFLNEVVARKSAAGIQLVGEPEFRGPATVDIKVGTVTRSQPNPTPTYRYHFSDGTYLDGKQSQQGLDLSLDWTPETMAAQPWIISGTAAAPSAAEKKKQPAGAKPGAKTEQVVTRIFPDGRKYQVQQHLDSATGTWEDNTDTPPVPVKADGKAPVDRAPSVRTVQSGSETLLVEYDPNLPAESRTRVIDRWDRGSAAAAPKAPTTTRDAAGNTYQWNQGKQAWDMLWVAPAAKETAQVLPAGVMGLRQIPVWHNGALEFVDNPGFIGVPDALRSLAAQMELDLGENLSFDEAKVVFDQANSMLTLAQQEADLEERKRATNLSFASQMAQNATSLGVEASRNARESLPYMVAPGTTAELAAGRTAIRRAIDPNAPAETPHVMPFPYDPTQIGTQVAAQSLQGYSPLAQSIAAALSVQQGNTFMSPPVAGPQPPRPWEAPPAPGG